MQSFFMWTMKILIRCTGWFESSLGAHVRRYIISHCGPVLLISLSFTPTLIDNHGWLILLWGTYNSILSQPYWTGECSCILKLVSRLSTPTPTSSIIQRTTFLYCRLHYVFCYIPLCIITCIMYFALYIFVLSICYIPLCIVTCIMYFDFGAHSILPCVKWQQTLVFYKY